MKTGSIVLIDDSKDEILLSKEVMKEAGIPNTLITFEDGLEALSYIFSNAPNIFLIICDINMPRMSGFDLLHKIKERDNLKLDSIPFVFLSNSCERTDVMKAYRLKAHGYFQKAWDIEGMIRTFQRIVGYWDACEAPDTITGSRFAEDKVLQLELSFGSYVN